MLVVGLYDAIFVNVQRSPHMIVYERLQAKPCVVFVNRGQTHICDEEQARTNRDFVQ